MPQWGGLEKLPSRKLCGLLEHQGVDIMASIHANREKVVATNGESWVAAVHHLKLASPNFINGMVTRECE